MTGSIDAFFYNTLAGIKIDEEFPGCERITIKPYIPESLSFVTASIETVKGRVAVHWEKSNSELILNIEIPANSVADIYIPAKDAARIFESGIPVSENSDIKLIETSDSYCHYLVMSGKYRFVIKHYL
jgi:alpha-L-rhamnosidase